MEEIKEQAVRNEQKRLSRDLHDGLSSTVAGAKLQLELLALDGQPEVARKLTDIRHQIEHAYAIARGKSHQWYDTAGESEETNFRNRVQYLLESAFPDAHYTKEIHIDDASLSHSHQDVRIEFLRNVLEAVANIIKHTKARQIGRAHV